MKRPVGLDDRGMTVELAANTVRIGGVGVKVQANRCVILLQVFVLSIVLFNYKLI